MKNNYTTLLVAAFLIPPWAAFLLGMYWYFIDASPPYVINYSHPFFTAQPAESRVDATEKQITEALGGSTVWTYRETCVLRDISGTLRVRWDAEAFSWSVPEVAFLNSPVGCKTQAYAVILPTSNPTRHVVYRSTRVYDLNPIKTVEVHAPPIPITILANR